MKNNTLLLGLGAIAVLGAFCWYNSSKENAAKKLIDASQAKPATTNGNTSVVPLPPAQTQPVGIAAIEPRIAINEPFPGIVVGDIDAVSFVGNF